MQPCNKLSGAYITSLVQPCWCCNRKI